MATRKTAEETYAAEKAKTEALLARLADLLGDHLDDETPTWGEAGDLDEVNRYLRNAVKFLGGDEE